MGVAKVVPSHPCLCVFLLFWFGLFCSCCCGGTSCFVPRNSTWRHVGVGGKRTKNHVGNSISMLAFCCPVRVFVKKSQEAKFMNKRVIINYWIRCESDAAGDYTLNRSNVSFT
jgi:hypothetical protein